MGNYNTRAWIVIPRVTIGSVFFLWSDSDTCSSKSFPSLILTVSALMQHSTGDQTLTRLWDICSHRVSRGIWVFYSALTALLTSSTYSSIPWFFHAAYVTVFTYKCLIINVLSVLCDFWCLQGVYKLHLWGMARCHLYISSMPQLICSIDSVHRAVLCPMVGWI